ncbi:MAG TPA: hypothetical protein VFO10_18310 [Oligoflexus sp.]|uniref:hypothetical protein n=1 Tax=Oligoflexus sp. TaxID=1971216 RepID=UPI002D7F61AB|nr:hypothetical protein [Oligoflexus sp.]HET9239220.1 hypothetical protein [Oligoflexus sp.]
MNIGRRILLAGLVFKSSLVVAQDKLSRDDTTMELNFAYSQQEYGTIALDILAPRMGDWGRLGINLGGTSYNATLSSNRDRLMHVDQKALAWRIDEPLLNVDMASSPGIHTLGIASTLRVGIQSYENLLDEKIQREDHSFFEVESLFQLRSLLDDKTGLWIKRSTFGLGTGFRLNLIDEATFIGNKGVDRLHVYPTFQFSALIF